MPTLEVGSRHDNIHKSVNAFIDAQIRVGLSLSVYYEGQGRPFDPNDLPSTWVESDLIPGAQVGPVKVAASDRQSMWHEGFLNLNIFQKVDSGTTGLESIYTLTTTATNVAQLFGFQTVITIKDYNTVGTPTVDGLRVVAPPMPRPVPTPKELGMAQMNVSVALRHHMVSIN